VNEHASVWSNLRGKDVMGEQDKYPFCIDVAVGSEAKVLQTIDAKLPEEWLQRSLRDAIVTPAVGAFATQSGALFNVSSAAVYIDGILVDQDEVVSSFDFCATSESEAHVLLVLPQSKQTRWGAGPAFVVNITPPTSHLAAQRQLETRVPHRRLGGSIIDEIVTPAMAHVGMPHVHSGHLSLTVDGMPVELSQPVSSISSLPGPSILELTMAEGSLDSTVADGSLDSTVAEGSLDSTVVEGSLRTAQIITPPRKSLLQRVGSMLHETAELVVGGVVRGGSSAGASFEINFCDRRPNQRTGELQEPHQLTTVVSHYWLQRPLKDAILMPLIAQFYPPEVVKGGQPPPLLSSLHILADGMLLGPERGFNAPTKFYLASGGGAVGLDITVPH